MSRKGASDPKPSHDLRDRLRTIQQLCEALRITTHVTGWPTAFERVRQFQDSLVKDYGAPTNLRAVIEPQVLGALVRHGLPADRVRGDLSRVVGFVARFMT